MKTSFDPLVTVVIPTFERPQLTVRAIKSVLSQSYKDFEIYIINDGSTSDYSDLKEFISMYDNILYQETKNLGVSSARNLGIKLGRGEYYAFLDSDDEWFPNKLLEQINYLRINSACRLLHTKERWIREGQHVQTPKHLMPRGGDIFLHSLNICSICPSAVLIKKDVFEEFGMFDEDLRICEDYDLWLRITAYLEVGFIEEELVNKYSGPNLQLSKSEVAIDRFRVYALIKFMINNSTHPKITAVKEVLTSKLNILLNGAIKRNNNIEVEIYNALINKIDKFDISDFSNGMFKHLLDSKYNMEYKNPNLSYE